MKNRKQSEDIIISAVDRLIKEKGFTSLGINSIAKEASLSKVLIYRYFENLDGLLEAWAIKNSYWSHDSNPVPEKNPLSDNVKAVLSGYTNSLRNSPVKREVLRWLIAEETEVGKKVMKKNEENGLKLTKYFQDHPSNKSNFDAEAFFALMSAGISYLALMEDRADLFNGINLDSENGWNRIDNMMHTLFDLISNQ